MVGGMKKATRDEKLAAIDKIGEDEVLEWFAQGEKLEAVLPKLDVGYKLFYRWLRSVPGREQRFDDARKMGGHVYAERAVTTAENAANETVAVDRLQVDTFKWYAGKLNDAYDTRRQDVSVNISIQDLHAQAAELLEQEIIDVTPEEKDDG